MFVLLIVNSNFDLSGRRRRRVPPAASFLGKKLGKNLSKKGQDTHFVFWENGIDLQ
jgi:hypothetical protein